MSEYKFVERAWAARSLDELSTVLSDILCEDGFERFAVGLIPSDSVTNATIILDNLGEPWWKVAKGDNASRTRSAFTQMVRRATGPFAIPAEFHRATNERLAAAGYYYHPTPSTLVPFKTSFGIGYLLVSGPGNENVSEVVKQRLKALGAVVVLNWRRLSGGEGSGTLTDRERQALAHAAEGGSSAEIAEELGISERTVIAHLCSAMKKLDAKNRTAAVVEAIRRGLIDL